MYTFSSSATENAALIGYCVYPPSNCTVQARNVTAIFDSWIPSTSRTGPYNFSFARATGSGQSVPINGTSGVVIGSAEWGGTVPTPQTFLLHITGGVCGAGNSCFAIPKVGPVCDAGTGNTGAAYNSIPTDFANPTKACPPPNSSPSRPNRRVSSETQ